MIISHRGRNTGNRENTIAAFDKALELGAKAIECDLRLTLGKKIVVYHDNKITTSNLLSLEELFVYIEKTHVPFFLEVKSSSKVLAESIIKKIAKKDLWERVHIIGFSFFIGTSVRLQSKYPKLRVSQLINIPLYSYIRKPSPSYGVMLGWFDSWPGSEWLFRKLIPVKRLIKLRKFYEKNGFKVIAGVINNKSAFKYFERGGITDIVTDNVTDAVDYFKLNEKKE